MVEGWFEPDLNIRYTHTFPPLSSHFFCPLSTQQQKKLLLYRKKYFRAFVIPWTSPPSYAIVWDIGFSTILFSVTECSLPSLSKLHGGIILKGQKSTQYSKNQTKPKQNKEPHCTSSTAWNLERKDGSPSAKNRRDFVDVNGNKAGQSRGQKSALTN